MIRSILSVALAFGMAGKKIAGVTPHLIHQNTFYEGLDVTR